MGSARPSLTLPASNGRVFSTDVLYHIHRHQRHNPHYRYQRYSRPLQSARIEATGSDFEGGTTSAITRQALGKRRRVAALPDLATNGSAAPGSDSSHNSNTGTSLTATVHQPAPLPLPVRKSIDNNNYYYYCGSSGSSDEDGNGNGDENSSDKNKFAKKYAFMSRTSILDYTELVYNAQEKGFLGLLTCFWSVAMAFLLSLLLRHREDTGDLVSLQLARLLIHDAVGLFSLDIAMVASTAVVVPWIKYGIARRWVIRDVAKSWAPFVALVIFELLWIVGWVHAMWTRSWPWVQRCFFALHLLVNCMKMHAYVDTNMQLAAMHQELARLEVGLDGGDDKPSPVQSRKMRKRIRELKDALNLRKQEPGSMSFPNNLTLSNFAMFQLMPVLVYELNYPRTRQVRWWYLAEKVMGTVGIFIVFYIMVAHLILPELEKSCDQGIFAVTLNIMGPFSICWLLFFFITFDCICNGFSELTKFADRRFYDDWWNARGFDEFSRKWNRPVHMFIARHVYSRMYNALVPELGSPQDRNHADTKKKAWEKMRAKYIAMLAAFGFSSVLHEGALYMATMNWVHGIFFWFQMFQVPLIMAFELPAFHNKYALRNWAFWLSMIVGQSLLCVLYTRHAFAQQQQQQQQQQQHQHYQGLGYYGQSPSYITIVSTGQ